MWLLLLIFVGAAATAANHLVAASSLCSGCAKPLRRERGRMGRLVCCYDLASDLKFQNGPNSSNGSQAQPLKESM